MLNRYYRKVKRNRMIWLTIGTAITLGLCLAFLLTDILAPFGVLSPMKNPRESFLEWVCERTDNQQSIYVELEDATLHYTGIQWGTEQFKQDVYLMRMEGKWVVVLLDDSLDSMKTDHQFGYFSAEYGGETIQKLIIEIADQYHLKESRFLPVVLEETSFTSSFVLLGVYAGVLLLLLILFFICLVQMIDPRHSKTIQKLSRYGDVDVCVKNIEMELRNSEYRYPISTENWIFARGGFAMLELVPFQDIVWYHESRLQNADGEAGFGLVFYCYRRQRPVICWSSSKSEIAQIKLLQERLLAEKPWIDSDFHHDKARLWRQSKIVFFRRYGKPPEN